MTVIAWDGRTLAADKQGTQHNLKMTVTKIHKINGCLLFSSGELSRVTALYHWFEQGALESNYPDFQNVRETYEPLTVIKPDGRIWRYEMSAHPFEIEEVQYACGSGRDFALAAMKVGKNAVQAVEIACEFDPNCGMGMDVLTLDPQQDPGIIPKSIPNWRINDV